MNPNWYDYPKIDYYVQKKTLFKWKNYVVPIGRKDSSGAVFLYRGSFRFGSELDARIFLDEISHSPESECYKGNYITSVFGESTRKRMYVNTSRAITVVCIGYSEYSDTLQEVKDLIDARTISRTKTIINV